MSACYYQKHHKVYAVVLCLYISSQSYTNTVKLRIIQTTS